jgi:hypothetical protein
MRARGVAAALGLAAVVAGTSSRGAVQTKAATVPPPAVAAVIAAPAFQLTLSQDDVPAGWAWQGGQLTWVPGSQSNYSVCFSKPLTLPPLLQNAVAVFPSVEEAAKFYYQERSEHANASPGDAIIGDDCFRDTRSGYHQKYLVFIRANVVAQLWLLADSGDIDPYARIVDAKITEAFRQQAQPQEGARRQ